MQCCSQVLEVQTCVIMCVKRVGADGSPFFKWHFNYKVVQHHIITLLQTPKATKTTHILHVHYKTPNVSTHKHRHSKTTCLCTRKDSAVFIFQAYQNYVHTLQRTGGRSRRSRSKKMWLKTNTQGHPPPHKQGISLPKTKRPEQPTHIQRNREGWKGASEKRREGGGGDQKTCYMGGKVEQNHSLL